VGFLGFLLFTSNPFLRLDPAPFEGTELNPLLQDPGLSSTRPFSTWATSASRGVQLRRGRPARRSSRRRLGALAAPWVLAAWVPLTCGITAGSAWAYYELGWGGWWFWDPVENASLMPWLWARPCSIRPGAGAAGWPRQLTILLSVLTFSLSLVAPSWSAPAS
jgi:cytochrome c-type biogenesis protein CcmF